jgi:hypothetical protein
MYEVRNSYGTDWGDAGHFWIPGDYLEDRDLADDFWTIRKLGPGLNPDMPQDSTVNQVGFNPFHDEHGKFATGPIKAFLAGPAKDIVHTVGSKLNDNKRELLAAAITFSLYHVAGADFPADVEEAIHAQVVNFAENAQVSVGIAKDYMSRAVAAMIALRTERNAKKLKVARDEVLEALTGLQTILDNMDVGKLGFNPNHDEKGRFATSEFTDAEFDKAIKGVSAHFTMDEDIPNYVKLSVGERNIIHDYTGPSYLGINNSLRRQTLTPEQQDYVEKLNSALGRMPNYEGTTDRVGSNNPDVLKVYQDAVGKTIEERAFLSTKRSDSSFDPGHRPLVNFTIQGKTGKDIARIAFNPEEREVLFRSGTRFKVISVKKAKDGKYDTVLREV